MQMKKWSPQLEEELALLIKDWLKTKERTQADLRRSLNSESSRMPALLENLKKEYLKGGMRNIAKILCQVEKGWANKNDHVQPDTTATKTQDVDPFGQLDLLLEEIREDCENGHENDLSQ